MQLQQQRIGTRKGRNKGKYERHSNFIKSRETGGFKQRERKLIIVSYDLQAALSIPRRYTSKFSDKSKMNNLSVSLLRLCTMVFL